MHFGHRLQGSPFDYGRPEGVSVRERHTNLEARRGGDQVRGFSMIEMCVVLAISLVIASIAVIQIQPALQQVRANTAKVLSELGYRVLEVPDGFACLAFHRLSN